MRLLVRSSDSQFCHLSFSNDHGRWYKSKTPIEKFPRGFDEPVVAMQDATAGRLFEACNVYKINGSRKYLALIEAFDNTSNYRRYFRSWTADSLEGPWTVLHDDASSPFAGTQNVAFDGTPWTDDISHGELIRAGYDETMAIDGTRLQYLYQGFTPGTATSDYNAIPWRIGLLTLKWADLGQGSIGAGEGQAQPPASGLSGVVDPGRQEL